MATVTVNVGSSVGLHARPAALIAQAAGQYADEVMLGLPGGQAVSARSSLLIMTLGAGKGAAVEVTGADAAAVEAIADLVAQDLDA